jgi:membrane protein YdbS with pleckstrin-like domain
VAYSELILRDDEQLILDLHPHWWYFAKAMAATVITVFVALVVLVTNLGGDNGFGDALKIIAAVLVIGSLIWLGERYVHWVSTYFILTTDRIIFREGIVAKHGMEIPLQRINTIFFSQRIFERILGLGDLKIESASKTGAEVFEDIRSPDKVQHEIYAQMEALDNRGYDRIGQHLVQGQTPPAAAAPAPPAAAAAAAAPAPPPPTPPAPDSVSSPADRIAELHRLHTQGAITDAEFEAKKAELLDRM